MLARELNVIGLVNIQYVVYKGEVYVIEVNPRSSRTVPSVSYTHLKAGKGRMGPFFCAGTIRPIRQR